MFEIKIEVKLFVTNFKEVIRLKYSFQELDEKNESDF